MIKKTQQETFHKPLALIVTLVTIFVMAGCSGGSGSSGSTGTGTDISSAMSQYVMPSEISAVPTATSTGSAAQAFRSGLRQLALQALADLPADSDYTKAGTRKYVEEHTLKQFDILQQVLTNLNQSHYFDQIGQAPYKAMVVQPGEGDGSVSKTLEAWQIESDIIDQNGNVIDPTNAQSGVDYRVRVRCWIEEADEGEVFMIKGEFIITTPPTQNEDGSYADYGEWTLNVSFDDTGNDFFAAACALDDSGNSVITLKEKMPEGDKDMEVIAKMVRNADEGYGKVQYPDFEAMFGPDQDANAPPITATYAYNDSILAVKEGSAETVYKSRIQDPIEMTHRYGVFDAVTGEDVLKTKSFGFPFFYTDTTYNITRRGYYGAWQGRHQVWTSDRDGQNNPLLPPEDTVLTREDFGDAQIAETYKMGPTINGTFVKRTYVDADLDDIVNIPVEIWINQDYQLSYNSADSTWYYCPQIDWGDFSCMGTPEDFGATIGWEILSKNPEDNRKQVNINGWDQNAMTNRQYVYLQANAISQGVPGTSGLYLAQQDPGTGRITPDPSMEALDTSAVTQIWVNVGGSIFVEYKGDSTIDAYPTDWVEKEVTFFNQNTWTPEFNPNGDKNYILPENRELYVNLQGANYVVRKVNGTTTAKLELQTTANPSNVLSGGAMAGLSGYTFKEPWAADSNSTYAFTTDPADPNYLMLVYASIGDNDKDQSGDLAAVGDLVEKDIWGIVAYSGSTQMEDADGNPLAFNWEYDSDGAGMQDWGSVTYLLNADDTYKLLDDPIRFTSITAQNNNGVTKNLSLQYDGWMMGLPDMYQELEKNDWTMTSDLSGKIINLAAGTELTDASDPMQHYYLKPLEISQFLPVVTDTTGLTLPDITQGANIDLNTVFPTFTPPDMGDPAPNAVVLYSEGKLVD